MRLKIYISIICAAVLLFSAAAGEEFTVADIHIEQSVIPDSQAMQFTRALKAGWNLGNTFDAVDVNWVSDKLRIRNRLGGCKNNAAAI